MTTAIKSISVSLEFDEMARQGGISWTEASKLGMAIKLAELGLLENSRLQEISVFQKIQKLQSVVKEMNDTISTMDLEIKNLRNPVLKGSAE